MNFETARVWINVPYRVEYLPLRHAIEVVLWAFGFQPFLASDETRSQVRIDKLVDMIETCEFGITEVGSGPFGRKIPVSYNMPFEHAIMWHLSLTGRFHKPVLLCSNRHGPDIWFSNMRGTDALGHNNDPIRLIEKLYHWITTDTAVFKRAVVNETDLHTLTTDVIKDIWAATWPKRTTQSDLNEIRKDVADVVQDVCKSGWSIIADEFVAPRSIDVEFPPGFRPRYGFTFQVQQRRIRVPFNLYSSAITQRSELEINTRWSSQEYYSPPSNLRRHNSKLIAAYRSRHGEIGENEDVTRLDRIEFRKNRKRSLLLLCRKLKRWEVIASNWMLDFELDKNVTLRTLYSINAEIVRPDGLDSSPLGNTLGISLVVGCPSRKQVLLCRRTGAVNHPRPHEIKVSGGGEVRPAEWRKYGPNVAATAQRIATEEAGIPKAAISHLACIGIGRSAVDGVPELLFEATTESSLDEFSTVHGGTRDWENKYATVVSCSQQRPAILSWLLQPGSWSAQHLVCCILYLRRNHPELFRTQMLKL